MLYANQCNTKAVNANNVFIRNRQRQ